MRRIDELPSQLCEMLYRSPSLRKLSISSLQGRGWSLDVSPLILSPSARFPSLESLIFFGSTCTLGTRGNFEQEEREMIKFLLNLKVGELGLGGSIARRQFEFGILDGLELGEREVMFPNIISYHGTSVRPPTPFFGFGTKLTRRGGNSRTLVG